MEWKFEPIAMDAKKSGLVVFEMQNDDSPNMYIWVNVNEKSLARKVRVKSAIEFPLYWNWTGEYLDMSGDFPREIINSAIITIEENEEHVSKGIEKFNQEVERRIKNDDIDSLLEWDDQIRNGREEVIRDYKGENKYNGKIMF